MIQKWEYMLVVNFFGSLTGEVYFILPSGEKKKHCGKDSGFEKTVKLINLLSKEGWEVAGVTDTTFGGPLTGKSTWTLQRWVAE